MLSIGVSLIWPLISRGTLYIKYVELSTHRIEHVLPCIRPLGIARVTGVRSMNAGRLLETVSQVPINQSTETLIPGNVKSFDILYRTHFSLRPPRRPVPVLLCFG